MSRIDSYGNNIFSLAEFKKEQISKEQNCRTVILLTVDKSLWNEEIQQPDDSHLAVWQDLKNDLIWIGQGQTT